MQGGKFPAPHPAKFGVEACDFQEVWDALKHQLALLELLYHCCPCHLPLLKLIKVITTER